MTTIETLERRLLMDGNVKLALSGDDLVITGDKLDNVIRITRPAAGKLRVAGLDGTKVNSAGYKDFSAAFDDLKILMKQGGEDEVLMLGPITVPGDLKAEMGAGEIAIEGSAGAIRIGGDLNVVAGKADVMLRNEVIVSGNTQLKSSGSVTAASNTGIVPDFKSARFTDSLNIDNPYFPLVPGSKYTYESKSVDPDTGETEVETIVFEVTNQTKTILGVKTRVIRDRVYLDGLLVEDTFDWHAQDDNGNVWYFGEDTTDIDYDDEGNEIGRSSGGSWIAGVDGAAAGVVMPARPTVGQKYHQEFAPGDVLDHGEVLATNETVKLALGTFNKVVRTRDTTVKEPDALEHKLYAPGLGMIKEDKLDPQSGEIDAVVRLISVKLNGKSVKQVVSPTGFTGVNVTGRSVGAIQLLGESVVRSDRPVVVKNARLGDEIEIFSKAQVTLLDTTLEDITIQAGDSVGLNNVTATEEVLIRGNMDVFIINSRLRADTEIILGTGDNELVIGKSTFADLDADGGAGEDTFDDRGGNRFGELELERFEE